VLLEPLGAGGMGEVWKARDTRLDRIVAIKWLKGEHTARFEQEARAIAALNHPNICVLYDVGPDYLVMEYIDGLPLRGPLPVDQALRLGIQIAGALEAAHSKGIMHRDLKPANVLIAGSSAKLLDFGLSKLMANSATDVTETVEGAVLGTAAYMSPEQAQGKPLDERSDVFSFGAVLYEMLSGARAFGGGSMLDTLNAVVRDEPAPLESPVADIVKRCLAKKPAQRFQSMTEVKTALELVSTRPAEKQPSIAVLPFANMSADKENEYFSDGLSEEIINALTKVTGLKVTARTSAFSFRGKDVEIGEIARKLNVEHILEGSIRKSGNRIRVTAQLIKAADGFHVWSERYDRELTDVFAIQDEISAAIAGQLKLSLTLGAARRTPKLAAYEALLESRHHWYKLTPDGIAKSLECVERALAIDPEYADAYVGLGAYYFGMAWFGEADPREMIPKARIALQKALALDDTSAEAHGGVGVMKAVGEYHWAVAGEHFRRALTLGRSPQVSLEYAIWYLRPQGRLEEALAELEILRQQDPLSAMARSEMAHVLLLMRRYEGAAEVAQQALDLEPNYLLALFTVINVRVEQKRHEEAIALAERAVQVHGRWLVPLTYLGYAYAASARLAEARGVLEEMHEVAGRSHVNATAFANIYTALREVDTAVDWLEKAIDQREPIVTLLKTMSLFDPIRSHPRYPALLQKMNLA
jgi:TolB-like protein